MNIGWREVSINRTATRRLCGHISGGPSEVFDQSYARVRAPVSPPAAKKSLTIPWSIRAASRSANYIRRFGSFSLIHPKLRMVLGLSAVRH